MVFSIVTCCRVSKKTLPGRYAGGSVVEEKYIYRRGDYAPRKERRTKSGIDCGVGGVLLDELAAGIHVLAHEHREDAVGLGGVADVDALEQSVLGIHGGLPQLLGVHLTQTFESLHCHAVLVAAGIGVDELAQLPRLCPAGWQQQHPHL